MAIDFYFAGSQAIETEELMVTLNANVLKSYINDKNNILKWFEYKKNGWKGKLIIDNGAFTIHRKGGIIDIDKYIAWLNENDEYIDYAIALDDIPGKWGQPKTAEDVLNSPIKTWENYIYMVKHLKSPHKILPVFHMGENFNHLENMLESPELKSDYICLSGNKELTNAQREAWYTKCFHIIKNSNRPDIKTHCLGSATMQNAEKFPFTSMDATSWIMNGANGNIFTRYGTVYVGDGGKSLTADEQKIVKELLDKYGLDFADIENYKVRMLFNIYYLHEKSLSVEFKGLSASARRLF